MKTINYIIVSGLFLIFTACDSNQDTQTSDLNYVNSLEGDYTVDCNYGYFDSFGNYQQLDTTYVTALSVNNGNYMSMELYDGVELFMRFNKNHNVDVLCLEDSSFVGNSVWSQENGITQFNFNLHDGPCSSGYLSQGGNLYVGAVKL